MLKDLSLYLTTEAPHTITKLFLGYSMAYLARKEPSSFWRKTLSPQQIVRHTQQLFQDLDSRREPTLSNPIIKNNKWKRPDADMFKINVDGATFGHNMGAGIGVVIRDSMGMLVK